MPKTTITINGEDKASGAINAVKGSLGKLGEIAKSAAVLGAMTALVDVTKQCVTEFIKSEQTQAQLQAVLKSTGGAAGLTSTDINKLAVSLSEMTTFEDDAIISASNMLLTFTNVGKKVFPEAIKAAQNMAIAIGGGEGSLNSMMQQLGKALDDPINGIAKLQRVGVQFTQAEKDQIKAMQEANDMAGAQAIILQKLETQFGGSAAAARDTFGGAVTALKNQFGNLQESIGSVVANALKPIVNIISSAVQWFNNLDEGLKDNIITFALVTTAVLGIVAAVSAIIPVMKMLTTVMMANPILLIATGAALAIAGIVLLVKNFDMVKLKISEFAEGAGHVLFQFFMGIRLASLEMVSTVLANVARMTTGLFDIINTALKSLGMNQISNVFDDGTQAIVRMEHETRSLTRTENEQHEVRKKQIQDQIKDLEKKSKKTKEEEEDLERLKKKLSDVGSVAADVSGKVARAMGDASTGVENSFTRMAGKALGSISGIFNAIKSLGDAIGGLYDNAVAALEASLTQQTAALDEQMNAELEIAGLQEETEVEAAANRVTALEEELSTTTDKKKRAALQEQITEARKEAEKAAIKERYEQQKLEAEKKAAMERYRLESEQFKVSQALGVSNALVSTAQGIVAAWSTAMQLGPIAGPIAGGILTGALATIAGVQIASIMSQQPPAPPAFADGGTMPYSGMALVGERGPELVNLPGGSQVFSNEQSRGMMGEAFHFNAPITVIANDPQEFYNQMRAQARYERGRA